MIRSTEDLILYKIGKKIINLSSIEYLIEKRKKKTKI